MPSLGGPCRRSGGVGDWSGPRKRRGSSDIPLVKLVRRDLAPSQIVTPGVPQGNRSIPQLPVVSNGLSRIEPTAACRRGCFVLGFHFLFSALVGPTSFLFYVGISFDIRRACQARPSSSKRLPTTMGMARPFISSAPDFETISPTFHHPTTTAVDEGKRCV